MKIFALKKNNAAILILLLIAGYCSWGQSSDPEWDACLHEAQQLYDRGQFYDIQKKIDQCHAEYKNVLHGLKVPRRRKKSLHEPMYKILALTYYQLKMFDVAEKYMDALMQINPKYHPAYPYELAKMTDKYRSRFRSYAAVSVGMVLPFPESVSYDYENYENYEFGLNLSFHHMWQYDFGRKDLRGVLGEFGLGINSGYYSLTRAVDSMLSFEGRFVHLRASLPLRIGFTIGHHTDERLLIIVGLNNEFQIFSHVQIDYPIDEAPSEFINKLRKFYSPSLELGVRYWSSNWNVELKVWAGTYMLRGNTSSGSYLPAPDAYTETDFRLGGISLVLGLPLRDYSTKPKK